nr:hypothetical protein [Gammaproteobacteria bacterium]
MNRKIRVRTVFSRYSAPQTRLWRPTAFFGFILFCLFALHAFSCVTAPPSGDPQRILRLVLKGPDRANERILVDLHNSHLAADIWSPSGIGRATLKRDLGSWPEHLTIFLHLVTLEGFSAKSDTEEFTYALSHEENVQRQARSRAGEDLAPIEIALPRRLLAPSAKEITMAWIDAYRG